MARVVLTVCLVTMTASLGLADRLILVDGREFVGVVSVDGDTVQVQMEYGTIQFSASEVRDIEWKDTPGAELDKKLQALAKDDLKGLLELAQWAGGNDLPRQARKLYERALTLEPNNATARTALDYAWINGQWRSFEQGLELARNKLDAGHYDSLIGDVLPSLEALAVSKDRLISIRELLGQANLRGAKFQAAAKIFDDLSSKASGARSVRFAAIAGIIKDNADGLYVLDEPYPPTAKLLTAEPQVLKAGPASLSEPLVLEAALRDRAKEEISAGRKFIQDAQKADDPDTAKARYAQATQAFDRADALVPDIARSYRIEIVRRRIAALRNDADLDAKAFDKEMASLGKTGMVSQAYRNKVLRLIYLLDRVRDNLKQLLEVAKPYPRELVLEAKWAELDLKKLKEMREVLTGELDGKR
ncbi:MAG TPA: hypothetical protein VM098_10105 [Phycisphaerae bacterium]|nr:hypothetical protein [Phycisphaerae bacterium]